MSNFSREVRCVGDPRKQAEFICFDREQGNHLMNKYLLLYRSPANTPSRAPSPEEMQAMFQAWDAWKTKFKANMVSQGDGLKPGGRVLGPDDNVTDGPFIEAKEVLGGFSIIQAESYEQALEVSRACPVRQMPGNSVEIREMAGY